MQKIKYSVADIFGINVPKSVKITGMAEKGEWVPEHAYDPDYHFRTDLLRDLLAWWEYGQRGEGLFLTGPTGSGKTSAILQIAVRLNWPCQHITAHESMELSDLVGRPIINTDGSMGFQYGALAIAMKEGHLFLINEKDALQPGVSLGLNGIAEGEPLVIPENGGEVIKPHSDFRIVTTGNTKGNGDSGMFHGTNRQNKALLDRFWVVEVGYMDPKVETKLLMQKTGISKDKATLYVQSANEIRKLHENDQIDDTMSTRVLIRWANLTQYFYAVSGQGKSPVHYALDRAILNRAEPETKDAVHEVVQRIFGE